MSWRDLEGINSPLDPPFYDLSDEYAAIAEELAELDELEEKPERYTNKPNYHLLDEIPLEELPF